MAGTLAGAAPVARARGDRWAGRVALGLTLVPLEVSAVHLPVGVGGDHHPTSDLAATEMAVRLSDVVIRRTGLGAAGPPDERALARCAAIAADELEWSADRTSEEIVAVKQFYTIT